MPRIIPHFGTADLCDQHGDTLQVSTPVFKHFGGHSRFCGPISTLRIFEDNGLVRQRLESAGEGRVLVIDGAGSLRFALLGDQLAELAVKNDWAGILVHGCIRDSELISSLPIGVMALGTHPRKTVKRNQGEIDVTVGFSGVSYAPNQYLYADRDGIVVAVDALL